MRETLDGKMSYPEDLLSVCARHVRGPDDDVVVPDAYLPHRPPNWNGVLVLGEAQNLSRSNERHVDELLASNAEGRMTRLRDPENLRVAPWDDGSLKLAIEAAFSIKPSETAVSNAVPWSRRDADGSNMNPTPEMIRWAVAFWEDLLPLLAPSRIIAAGRVAQTVVALADPSSRFDQVPLRLPSPQAMSRVSGMFRKEDLLSRYPEVREVVQRNPEWSTLNRIFFACHTVSVASKRGVS